MGKKGVNEPCPCGSGKKYKKCCLNERFAFWKANAVNILSSEEQAEKIHTAFFKVLEFIDDNQWQGACHATASVLFVLFSELGLAAELIAGQVHYTVADGDRYFDHSWVEVDGKIYDAAVYLSLQDTMAFPPVVRDIDVKTMQPHTASYGCASPYGLDAATERIIRLSLTDYMNNFPASQNGLWDIVVQIGEAVDLELDISPLQQKYNTVKWVLKETAVAQ